MKLSQLRSLCDKAIEKYGDMDVGTYDKDYAYHIEKQQDMYDFKLRILSGGGSLPGEKIDDDENLSESPNDYYACIFYED
jgi:hypothetical protein